MGKNKNINVQAIAQQQPDIFRDPAVFASSVYTSMAGPNMRLTFAEQTPDGKLRGRGGVLLGLDTLAQLGILIDKTMAQLRAQAVVPEPVDQGDEQPNPPPAPPTVQ
jgi:hypothetical protein